MSKNNLKRRVTQRTTRRYIPEDGTLQEKNGSLESKHE
jgi:hypothetical protein